MPDASPAERWSASVEAAVVHHLAGALERAGVALVAMPGSPAVATLTAASAADVGSFPTRTFQAPALGDAILEAVGSLDQARQT